MLRKHGFTLIEVLIATVITLILMGVVVTIFGIVGDGVAETRANIQMGDQHRATVRALRNDLAGATVRMLPTLPGEHEGVFEFVEGPVGPLVPPPAAALITTEDKDANGVADFDSSVGDYDDILILTTKNSADPFVGRVTLPIAGGGQYTAPLKSQVAEVAWFVRGNTLYRRALLVRPGHAIDMTLPAIANNRYYEFFDLSAHQVGGVYDRHPIPAPISLVANSLADLAKRENRYAHQPYVYPHDLRFWGVLGLPTLRECTAVSAGTGFWPFPLTATGGAQQSNIYADPKSTFIVPPGLAAVIGTGPVGGIGPSSEHQVQLSANTTIQAGVLDLWQNPNPWTDGAPGYTPMVDPITGTLLMYTSMAPGVVDTRFAEDAVLNNVLSFDVKVWDPEAPVLVSNAGFVVAPGEAGYLVAFAAWQGAGSPAANVAMRGAYVDLNYLGQTSGNEAVSTFSGPGINPLLPMVYDTWSDHYERDGIDQDGDGLVDEGTDGFDNDGYGGVDNLLATEPFVDGNNNGYFDAGESYTDMNGNGRYDPFVAAEAEAPAPYPVPLRGVQVKIRVFEPDSRQVREVTIVQKYLPE